MRLKLLTRTLLPPGVQNSCSGVPRGLSNCSSMLYVSFEHSFDHVFQIPLEIALLRVAPCCELYLYFVALHKDCKVTNGNLAYSHIVHTYIHDSGLAAGLPTPECDGLPLPPMWWAGTPASPLVWCGSSFTKFFWNLEAEGPKNRLDFVMGTAHC